MPGAMCGFPIYIHNVRRCERPAAHPLCLSLDRGGELPSGTETTACAHVSAKKTQSLGFTHPFGRSGKMQCGQVFDDPATRSPSRLKYALQINDRERGFHVMLSNAKHLGHKTLRSAQSDTFGDSTLRGGSTLRLQRSGVQEYMG